MPSGFTDKKRSARPWALMVVGILAGISLFVWSGCGTPQERYKTLSFFFDGVPDPDAPPVTKQSGGGLVSSDPASKFYRAPVYSHKPFAEQKCEQCHGNVTNATEMLPTVIDASVCQKCHEGKTAQYPIMHGPVAVGACLWCHDAHQSSQPHLIKEATPKLCLRCHEQATLPQNPADHQSKTRSCLDCHVAHGSEKHGLLREGASTQTSTQPSTQPATQPATRPTPPPQPAAEMPPFAFADIEGQSLSRERP